MQIYTMMHADNAHIYVLWSMECSKSSFTSSRDAEHRHYSQFAQPNGVWFGKRCSKRPLFLTSATTSQSHTSVSFVTKRDVSNGKSGLILMVQRSRI